jgi:hypothetical protein
MAKLRYLRIAPATSLSLALLSASSCGYYDNTRQRFLDAGGISSSGNKTDDEDEDTQQNDGEGAPPAADGGAAPQSDSDTYPGSVVPQKCDEKDVPSLKGHAFEAIGAANALADDCRGDDVAGRIECAATLSFGKVSVEVEYAAIDADAGSDPDATGRIARHEWKGCQAAVEIYIERQVGVLEAHAFTLSEDRSKLSHVATGRTFTLVEEDESR